MIRFYDGAKPIISDTAFVAETAVLIGQVSIDENVNIWYNTVVRGDVEPIRIGANTNIQDLVMLHTSKHYPLTIGENVTVGHGAIIHGCTIESNVLIGMGAIVLDGAIVESNVIIGAGSLIPPGKVIPKGSMAMGSPAKVVRTLTDEEISGIERSSRGYVELSRQYKSK